MMTLIFVDADCQNQPPNYGMMLTQAHVDTNRPCRKGWNRLLWTDKLSHTQLIMRQNGYTGTIGIFNIVITNIVSIFTIRVTTVVIVAITHIVTNVTTLLLLSGLWSSLLLSSLTTWYRMWYHVWDWCNRVWAGGFTMIIINKNAF